MAVRRKKDDQPMPEVHSDWQSKQVLRARDPRWLRARAAGCRAIVGGTWRLHDSEHTTLHLRYAHLKDPHSLILEAERCEACADAIERGEPVDDWFLANT